MKQTSELRAEAQEALAKVWFIQRIEELDHTDSSISLRLHIRPGLFVQAFLGEYSGSLYFALIEHERRIFGIDREAWHWHLHPFDSPEQHLPLTEPLEPKPLLTFLARVETLIIEQELW